MTARGGPPDKKTGGPDTTPNPAALITHHTPAASQISNRRKVECNRTPRRIGPYTAGWKAGFRAGAVDALRRVGRALADLPDADVYQLAVIEDMADVYLLVSGDD